MRPKKLRTSDALIKAIADPPHGVLPWIKAQLVERQVNDGLWLTQELHRDGFDVTAAVWLKESEDGRWVLYVASRDVDKKGITAAYRVIHETFARKPGLWVSPFDVRLVGLDDPVAQYLLKIWGPRPVTPTRYSGSRFGNLNIDEAYMYGSLPQEAGTT